MFFNDEKTVCEFFGIIAADYGGFFQLKTADKDKLLFKYVVPNVRSYELVAPRSELKGAARELCAILMREVFGLEESIQLCRDGLLEQQWEDLDDEEC